MSKNPWKSQKGSMGVEGRAGYLIYRVWAKNFVIQSFTTKMLILQRFFHIGYALSICCLRVGNEFSSTWNFRIFSFLRIPEWFSKFQKVLLERFLVSRIQTSFVQAKSPWKLVKNKLKIEFNNEKLVQNWCLRFRRYSEFSSNKPFSTNNQLIKSLTQ